MPVRSVNKMNKMHCSKHSRSEGGGAGGGVRGPGGGDLSASRPSSPPPRGAQTRPTRVNKAAE